MSGREHRYILSIDGERKGEIMRERQRRREKGSKDKGFQTGMVLLLLQSGCESMGLHVMYRNYRFTAAKY